MAEKVEKLPVREEKLTPVQRLAKLDSERAEILATAKGEALEKATEAVNELNALGFHYLLCEEGEKPNGTRKGFASDAECPICKIRTVKPHDARSHRLQAIKAPFTDDELRARGLVKVP